MRAIVVLIAFLCVEAALAQISAEDEVVKMLAQLAPYHVVSPELFEGLGWELPDGGITVKALADATPGGALDPRELESIPVETLGYRASWHEVRFQVYGLDWDISGLQLMPANPLPVRFQHRS